MFCYAGMGTFDTIPSSYSMISIILNYLYLPVTTYIQSAEAKDSLGFVFGLGVGPIVFTKID